MDASIVRDQILAALTTASACSDTAKGSLSKQYAAGRASGLTSALHLLGLIETGEADGFQRQAQAASTKAELESATNGGAA